MELTNPESLIYIVGALLAGVSALAVWLVLPRKGRRAAHSRPLPPASQYPFARSFEKYEASVPLSPDFRFAHEPVYAEASSRFVGRQIELDTLVERLLFSDGGAFLVTGYRGVGKTSFVNQVIQKLGESLPWAETFLGRTEILDIHLNLARPVQPAELMHHIVRRLYSRLKERGIYPQLSPELREELDLAHQRTSVNMTRQMAASSEWGFGLEEADVGNELLKATAKPLPIFRRARSQNTAVSFLGYDDKAAEYDVIRISRQLTSGYAKAAPRSRPAFRRKLPPVTRLKILFVFDELDKLEEYARGGDGARKSVIDDILSALKNLFTTSGISFIFVAGKDLQERWLEDLGKGDSVYESVFSYDRYLPCMWANADEICDRMVAWDQLSRTATGAPGSAACPACSAPVAAGHAFCEKCAAYVLDPARARAAFGDFKKYLYFKGRGIPRRIIRGFNEYVQWDGQRPVLVFTKQELRRIRFYAGLQDVLATNERRLFGQVPEEIPGTQQDRRRLSVYYLVDWILRQGGAEFIVKDVIAASKRLSAKIAPADEVAPRLIADLLGVLVESEYLLEVRKGLDETRIAEVDARNEKPYRVAPRRLAEMGGLAGASEEESYVFGKEERASDRIGHYKLEEVVGTGGMGSVYRAWDEMLGRQVAVKVLRVNFSSDAQVIERFRREASIMSALHHPNIVRYYEFGEDAGRAYIVMDYAEGLDLQRVLRSQGRLEVSAAMSVARAVADAIRYIHEKGFVRLDIKPDNILVGSSDKVLITDFGIAKPAGEDSPTITLETALIGTPHYMSPEQWAGAVVDARSDIYSFGIVLYEMLTGRRPFTGATLTDLLEAHVSQPAPPPSQFAYVPPEVEAIILKCLEKSPDSRFQNFAEALAALDNVAVAMARSRVELTHIVEKAQGEVRQVEERERAVTLAVTATFSPIPLPQSAAAPPAPRGLPAAPPEAPTGLETTETFEPPRVSQRPGAQRPDAYLLGFNGMGTTVPLGEGKKTIGRSIENDIVLDEEKVSRFHAEVQFRGGNYYVADLNSINGVWVNGASLMGEYELHDGDLIRVGDSAFEFHRAVNSPAGAA